MDLQKQTLILIADKLIAKITVVVETTHALSLQPKI